MECVACGYKLRRWEGDGVALTAGLIECHERLCCSSETNRRQAGGSGQP
jgi:hypothetical protein